MELTECDLEKLAWVFTEADGGSCKSCTYDLLKAFERAFPENDHAKLKGYCDRFLDYSSDYKEEFEINNLP